MKKSTVVKPLIKWVGGKTQIIDTLISQFPTRIHNYWEPFVGGGSVLLAVLSAIRDGRIELTGNIHVFDLNVALISLYKNIQSNPINLYDEIQKFKQEYEAIPIMKLETKPDKTNKNNKQKIPKKAILSDTDAHLSQENYFYWMRQKYNQTMDKTTIPASAMFVFLNKTCFRGVFREGPNGFNVPFGHYKNPEIVDCDHLFEIHTLLNNNHVVFECSDFNNSISKAIENNNGTNINKHNHNHEDFMFLDPPYAPETATTFVGYTSDGFSLDQHNLLFDLIDRVTQTSSSIKVMMTNHNVSLIRDRFTPNHGYTCQTIECRRAINSIKPDSKTNEVIVKNYGMDVVG